MAINRRAFLVQSSSGSLALLALAAIGCRSKQTAQIVKPGEEGMVGSHAAGEETFAPLIDESVARLLGRHGKAMHSVSMQTGGEPPRLRVCFIGVENKSTEEIGDFKEQIYQRIDTKLSQGDMFDSISRRYVEAGLKETRLRPDQLFIPDNMKAFAATLEQMGQPFDFLLYATLSSGTTSSNKDYQRSYLLTLDLVNIHDGRYDKESAELTKTYNVSTWAKVKNFNPF